MSVHDLQRKHLGKVVHWAEEIREHLQPVLDAHRGRVHFRPSSVGATMVDLSPARPQLKLKTGIRDMQRFLAGVDVVALLGGASDAPGRVTPEKFLQSWLVSEAYKHGGQLASLNAASATTSAPVTLTFVTDEIAVLPASTAKKKILCDILAVREDGEALVPVVIELKNRRDLKRLVEQVTDFAALVDEHADLFADLYSATLGHNVEFTGPCEKWIVWPAAGGDKDPRESELVAAGIRPVGYREHELGFEFRVGGALP